MRWVYVIISVCGIVLAALAHSPGWFGLGVAMAAVFALIATVAFVHERISGSARSEDLSAFELQQLRDAMHRARADRGSDIHPNQRSTHGSH